MTSIDPLPRHSQRTSLRRLRAADLADFQAYRCDPGVARYQGWRTMSDDEARSFLVGNSATPLLQPGNWCQIAIADRASDMLIGDIGLYMAESEDEAEIGFSLHQDWQHQGLAREAVLEAIDLVFEVSKIRRVVANTDSRNAASIALLERVGMARMEEVSTTFRGLPCVEFVYARERRHSAT